MTARLTPSARVAVASAGRGPLFRCPGGWKGRDGRFVTLGLATRLLRAGLLEQFFSGKHGPYLVATTLGRSAITIRMTTHA